jgi:phosphate transport system protein
MKHTDRGYEEELSTLRDRLLRMGGRVEDMLARSCAAFAEHDAAAARHVIELDARVNGDEVEIDELALSILARRQPLASDLRSITLAHKMVTDLERIGDLCVNICERVIELAKEPPAVDQTQHVVPMCDRVRELVRAAIDAFAKRDAELAQKVIGNDDAVDELYHQALRTLIAAMAHDPTILQRGIHVQNVAKLLERIGDHATNIAEEVVFLVHGKDIRHMGKRSNTGGST